MEQAKVTSPIGAHAVGLGDDPHIGAVQCALHLGDERLVRDGAPSVISIRGADVGELLTVGFRRAAVED